MQLMKCTREKFKRLVSEEELFTPLDRVVSDKTTKNITNYKSLKTKLAEVETITYKTEHITITVESSEEDGQKQTSVVVADKFGTVFSLTGKDAKLECTPVGVTDGVVFAVKVPRYDLEDGSVNVFYTNKEHRLIQLLDEDNELASIQDVHVTKDFKVLIKATHKQGHTVWLYNNKLNALLKATQEYN